MFTLQNAKAKLPLSIEIHNGKGARLEFVIGNIISRRNPDELNPPRQYELFNMYIDYKGPGFREALFGLYVEAEETIMQHSIRKNINPMPNEMVHNILNMFTVDDVYYFIKNVAKIQPPRNLITEFNMQTEHDGLGTRAQTYTQNDYLELATFTIFMKAIFPVIGHYAHVKAGAISTITREYVLYNMISGHPISHYAPAIKLKEFSIKLIEMTTKEESVSAVMIIEKNIPRDELPDFITAQVILQKVTAADIVTDNEEKNVITRIHNFVINRLRAKTGCATKIRDKIALSDNDSITGDKESIVESYRIISELTLGSEVELDWATSDIDVLTRNLGIAVDRQVVDDAMAFIEPYRNDVMVTEEQIFLLGYIFKNIIDPRGLMYIGLDSIMNLMSVGFAALWALDQKHMAVLLVSAGVVNNDDTITINTTIGRNGRMSKEIKEELDLLYPYRRATSLTMSSNVAEEAINEISNRIARYRWVPLATSNYMKEAVPAGSKVLPVDLKSKLAEMLIKLAGVTHEQ